MNVFELAIRIRRPAVVFLLVFGGTSVLQNASEQESYALVVGGTMMLVASTLMLFGAGRGGARPA